MDLFVYCISFHDYNLSEWQSKHERIWEWDEFDGIISWFGRFECRIHSVRTHGPESNWFKYLIMTFLPDYNCCKVSGHMGPSPCGSNTRFRYFFWIRIVAQCLDTWAWVWLGQIPASDIFAELELLHCVQTHGPESNEIKYLILTFLLD